MFGRSGRLTWALIVGFALLVALVVTAVLNGPAKAGSGVITFGRSTTNFSVQGQSRAFAPKGKLAFVAQLKRAAGAPIVAARFQRHTATTWKTVWRLRARIASASDTILAGSYRFRFLAAKGMVGRGLYRLVIRDVRGRVLATGSFRLKAR